MPLSPQPRRRALTSGNLSLTNGDQTVTKVDTRLTKVDKTCHCQPLRRTPNNPEQIRTDPNKPKHRQTP